MTEEKKQPSGLALAVTTMKTEVGKLAGEFQRILPAVIPADKFVRTIQTAIQMNPEIGQATKQSVINACMKAAADGLILDGREATLTIFNTKKKGADGKDVWEKQAQYIPMVTGIIKRVRNSGDVARFNAFMRFENDLFKRTLGLDPTLTHEPNDENPGRPLGAYSVCLFKDGTVDYEYMSAKQILKIASKTKNAIQYDPEKGDSYEEWWRKTTLRRLSKRLPMDSDVRNVVERIDEFYEEDSDGGNATYDPITGEVIEASPKAAPKKRGAAAAMESAPKAAEEDKPAFLGGKKKSEPEKSEVIDADYTDVQDGADDLTEDVI